MSSKIDLKHIELQFRRLFRHYEYTQEKPDDIAFLDLAHSLRVWVDMKSEVDIHLKNRNIKPDLPKAVITKSLKSSLSGTGFTYFPEVLNTPTLEIAGLTIVQGPLSTKISHELEALGPPISELSRLTFSQWLGTFIFKYKHKSQIFDVSREILIKRVANMLGASHPLNMKASDSVEKKFDPVIRDLHEIQFDGYPITYSQLMGTAKAMIESNIKNLFI